MDHSDHNFMENSIDLKSYNMANYLLDTWTGLKEKTICTLVYKTFHKIQKFQANQVLQFMNIVAVKRSKMEDKQHL